MLYESVAMYMVQRTHTSHKGLYANKNCCTNIVSCQKIIVSSAQLNIGGELRDRTARFHLGLRGILA